MLCRNIMSFLVVSSLQQVIKLDYIFTPNCVAFAVFVDFREEYITFDFYIFHQAK